MVSSHDDRQFQDDLGRLTRLFVKDEAMGGQHVAQKRTSVPAQPEQFEAGISLYKGGGHQHRENRPEQGSTSPRRYRASGIRDLNPLLQCFVQENPCPPIPTPFRTWLMARYRCRVTILSIMGQPL